MITRNTEQHAVSIVWMVSRSNEWHKLTFGSFFLNALGISSTCRLPSASPAARSCCAVYISRQHQIQDDMSTGMFERNVIMRNCKTKIYLTLCCTNSPDWLAVIERRSMTWTPCGTDPADPNCRRRLSAISKNKN